MSQVTSSVVLILKVDSGGCDDDDSEGGGCEMVDFALDCNVDFLFGV